MQLVDGSDLSYVEDGTPCGPSMLCLDHKCLPVTAFNFSSCPGSWDGKICFDHGVRRGGSQGCAGPLQGADAVPSQVCSNEGKCICQPEWTGKDCSVYDPIPEPKPTGETERYKGQCALHGGSHRVPSSLPPPSQDCASAGHSWVPRVPRGPVPADLCPCPLLPDPGPSGTNIIIGSIAGAVLVAAIVLGGTGWGFK